MTDSEKAEQEYQELLQWVFDEEARVEKKLKKKSLYEGGLDGNSKYFSYIYMERERRIKELQNSIKNDCQIKNDNPEPLNAKVNA